MKRRERALASVRPNKESERLFREVLRQCPPIAESGILPDLLTCLFQHLDEFVTPEILWEKALGQKAAYQKDSADAGRVRQHCLSLRAALRDHFPKTRPGLRFDLEKATRTKGYRLRSWTLDDPQSVTRAFWKAHLDSSADISLVYIEQLFFEDPQDGIVFRFFDCNAEHTNEALAELRHGHHETAQRRQNAFPTYPYVAWGEIEARSLITRWFDDYALMNIEPEVTRHLKQDRHIWKNSLVLFGSAPGNRFVTDVLGHFLDLPIRLDDRAHVTVSEPTSEERERVDRFSKYGGCQTADGNGYVIEFNHRDGFVPIILTRIQNPKSRKSSVTLLNSDFGGAVHQLAHVLVDDERLQKAVDLLKIDLPFPDNFQVLCGVQIRAGRDFGIHALVWRIYTPQGI